MTDAEIDALTKRAITATKVSLLGKWHTQQTKQYVPERRVYVSATTTKIARLYDAARLEVAGMLDTDHSLRQLIVGDLEAMTKYLRGCSVQVASRREYLGLRWDR